MVAIFMKKLLERNGWTLRVTMSAIWQRKPFFSDDFPFSYFDRDLQNSQENQGFSWLIITQNYVGFLCGLELLRLYCRFDSYRRRSLLAVMKIVSLPLFSCRIVISVTNLSAKQDWNYWFCQREWMLVTNSHFPSRHPEGLTIV